MMDVVCDKCDTKIKIPDKKMQKIPKGQVFAIACPKCKNKISVENKSGASASSKSPAGRPAKPAPSKKPGKAAPPPEKPAAAKPDMDDDDDANPFDMLEDGAKIAILCESDAKAREKIKTALENLKYHIMESPNPRDALRQMRLRDFDVVVLNERFGTRDPDMNHVLKHLEQLPMVVRRNMFIALITTRFSSMDNMMAFNKSVNMLINMKDLNEAEKLLKRSVKDNDAFYRVYKESLQKIKG